MIKVIQLSVQCGHINIYFVKHIFTSLESHHNLVCVDLYAEISSPNYYFSEDFILSRLPVLTFLTIRIEPFFLLLKSCPL